MNLGSIDITVWWVNESTAIWTPKNIAGAIQPEQEQNEKKIKKNCRGRPMLM